MSASTSSAIALFTEKNLTRSRSAWVVSSRRQCTFVISFQVFLIRLRRGSKPRYFHHGLCRVDAVGVLHQLQKVRSYRKRRNRNRFLCRESYLPRKYLILIQDLKIVNWSHWLRSCVRDDSIPVRRSGYPVGTRSLQRQQVPSVHSQDRFHNTQTLPCCWHP